MYICKEEITLFVYTLLLYFARVVFCSNLFLRAIFHLTSCCSLRTWLLRIYNGIWLRESDCFRTAIAIKSFPYTVCFSFSFGRLITIITMCLIVLKLRLLCLSLCVCVCILFWMLIKIIVLQWLNTAWKKMCEIHTQSAFMFQVILLLLYRLIQ